MLYFSFTLFIIIGNRKSLCSSSRCFVFVNHFETCLFIGLFLKLPDTPLNNRKCMLFWTIHNLQSQLLRLVPQVNLIPYLSPIYIFYFWSVNFFLLILSNHNLSVFYYSFCLTHLLAHWLYKLIDLPPPPFFLICFLDFILFIFCSFLTIRVLNFIFIHFSFC